MKFLAQKALSGAGFFMGFGLWYAALLLPPHAHAWGPTGHRVVGQIAQNHLTPRALKELRKLMGPETLAQSSTWPDLQRSNPAWNKADPWHYVDAEEEGVTNYLQRPKSPGGDIVRAILYFEEALLKKATESLEKKREALRFLVHFIGDLHQPLHVGLDSDSGGNKIEVQWFGEKTNLHRVWDENLIDHEKLSFTELTQFIDHASPKEVRDLQRSTVLDWYSESLALRKTCYDFPSPKLGWDYAYRHFPTVKQRLLKAGIRLAGVLNRILDQPKKLDPAEMELRQALKKEFPEGLLPGSE